MGRDSASHKHQSRTGRLRQRQHESGPRYQQPRESYKHGPFYTNFTRREGGTGVPECALARRPSASVFTSKTTYWCGVCIQPTSVEVRAALTGTDYRSPGTGGSPCRPPPVSRTPLPGTSPLCSVDTDIPTSGHRALPARPPTSATSSADGRGRR